MQDVERYSQARLSCEALAVAVLKDKDCDQKVRSRIVHFKKRMP